MAMRKKSAARPPLVGMFTRPCGVFLHLEPTGDALRRPWVRVLAGATRREMGLANINGPRAAKGESNVA